jgi:hypothetical protein
VLPDGVTRRASAAYDEPIAAFLRRSADEILGRLARADGFDSLEAVSAPNQGRVENRRVASARVRFEPDAEGARYFEHGVEARLGSRPMGPQWPRAPEGAVE